jgi:hypothetical protein
MRAACNSGATAIQLGCFEAETCLIPKICIACEKGAVSTKITRTALIETGCDLQRLVGVVKQPDSSLALKHRTIKRCLAGNGECKAVTIATEKREMAASS